MLDDDFEIAVLVSTGLRTLREARLVDGIVGGRAVLSVLDLPVQVGMRLPVSKVSAERLNGDVRSVIYPLQSLPPPDEVRKGHL